MVVGVGLEEFGGIFCFGEFVFFVFIVFWYNFRDGVGGWI